MIGYVTLGSNDIPRATAASTRVISGTSMATSSTATAGRLA